MITTAPARVDLAAIDGELTRAEQLWRATDDRTALLAVYRLALAARDNHRDAATITLGWTDQPGTPHLVVETVHDHHGRDITDDAIDDDDQAAAYNLAETNRHIWQRLITAGCARDTYRLDIGTIVATPLPVPLTDLASHTGDGATNPPETATRPAEQPPRPSRIEIVSYRDPDNATELRVFCDGVETTAFEWCEADPGAGHTLSDWRDTARDYAQQASPAAARVIREYWHSGEPSEYVTRD
jgi:hypothetical protein